MRHASTLALVVVVAGCGAPVFDSRVSTSSRAITDGRVGTQDDVGATVSLFMFGDSSCTGTLVAPRVVATAAHCLEGVGIDDLEIVFSATVPADADASDRAAVTSMTAHPEYSFSGNPSDDPDGLSDDRDIGVVVLASDAPIEPAPVVHMDDVDARMLPDESDVVIEGYGLTDFNGDGDYGRLYIATTPFVRRSASEFLAGRPGSPDTCNGDSGGPAFVVIDGTKHLAGITSRASLSSQRPCGDGGIYTLFGAFESFVEAASDGLYVAGGSDVDLPPPPPEGGGSCAGSCDDASPDESCFCDAFCDASGDCCADFAAECPAVGTWTCTIEQLEDEACDCDCGAPDPGCAADDCAPPPPPAAKAKPADVVTRRASGCASTPAALLWALLVLLRTNRRPRS